MKLTIIAAMFVVLATPAAAQPLDRPTLSEPFAPPRDRDRDRYLTSPPAIACPDQQTIDEMTAMRRLGDREGEAISGRSYGCGPVLRPRPGPFER